MFNSIKVKLVVWFMVVFFLFFAGLEVFLYLRLENLVISLADEHLNAELHTLANLMRVEEEHGQLETELEELSTAATGVYAEKLSGHYYQIVSADGRVIVRSPSLSLAEASLPVILDVEEVDFRTVTGPAGTPIRMVTQPFKFTVGSLVFQAADTMEDTYTLLSSFRGIILAISPLVFIVCGVGVFIVSSWALATLNAFTTKVSQITEENLFERLPDKGMARELKPLASSFNTMLTRLEGSFMRQRQFLSDASHELRTPTSIIKSFCDVTLGRERAAADYRDAIKKISDTVNRMCDIINRILVISRLDSKAIELKPVRIDLNEVMKDVSRLVETSALNKGITVGVRGAHVTVRGDREGITEVFTNLIENAIKYNKQGGSIDIDLREKDGFAVAEVVDTGIGIAEAELEKIFDRFYRVDASRGVTVGSGLGLAIVKTIVEAHGGRVEVKSAPGKGSAFTVFLPVYLEKIGPMNRQ